MAVVDRKQVEAAVAQATAQTVEPPRELSAEARALVDRVEGSGELRRLLEIRVPELIAYQNAAYAGEYVDFVRRVAEVEVERAPGSVGLAEAVARHLYRLMAYKDEYEVARLHLDAALAAQIQAKFGQKVQVYWHLHPPLLRALGLKKKIRLGAWFAPAFRLLRAMKGLRGTALDPFGYAEVRRVERALVGEYRQIVETALVRLSPVTHGAAVTLAELPDEIRGYEHIKLEGVARFRDRAKQLMAQLN
jgi:indolepyruvate ferredoxin oxidoreductase